MDSTLETGVAHADETPLSLLRAELRMALAGAAAEDDRDPTRAVSLARETIDLVGDDPGRPAHLRELAEEMLARYDSR